MPASMHGEFCGERQLCAPLHRSRLNPFACLLAQSVVSLLALDIWCIAIQNNLIFDGRRSNKDRRVSVVFDDVNRCSDPGCDWSHDLK
jgi:hypothetical protein